MITEVQTPLLSLKAIGKSFGGNIANDEVDLEIRPGEFHGLVGENGAGKTTLMNIVSGLYRPDVGEMWMNGVRRKWSSPVEALDAGVAMIHQDYSLIDDFSVAENVYLGANSGFGPVLPRVLNEKVLTLAQENHLDLARIGEPGHAWASRPARDLSPSERQRVALLTALSRKCRLLIMDEPTSVLTPQEADGLFRALARLKQDGVAVILITHKVREAMAICDRVTVLRQGSVVDTVSVANLDEDELATMMVGRKVGAARRQEGLVVAEETLLEVTGLSGKKDNGLEAFRDVDLTLRRSEILGIAGVDGSGQHQLIECIAGLRKVESGNIDYFRPGIPAYEACCYIPPNPKRSGLIPGANAAWNVGLRDVGRWRPKFIDRMKVDRPYHRRVAAQIIQEFEVNGASANGPIGELSGGNLQKFIVGRELSLERPVALVVNPTAGLDAGGIQMIRRRILDYSEQGNGTILVSNELDELLALCDRIIVFYNGKIAGEVDRSTATGETLGRLMGGLELVRSSITDGDAHTGKKGPNRG